MMHVKAKRSKLKTFDENHHSSADLKKKQLADKVSKASRVAIASVKWLGNQSSNLQIVTFVFDNLANLEIHVSFLVNHNVVISDNERLNFVKKTISKFIYYNTGFCSFR